MSLEKTELIKLSLIIGDYASPEKNKREESDRLLKELREKNLGLLCICLLEISITKEFSDDIKIMSLVLLRQIIEKEKHKWNEIEPSIKEKIKIASLNIIINDNFHINRDFVNKAISVIEQILTAVYDSSEEWPELYNLIANLYNLNFPNDVSKIYIITKILNQSVAYMSNKFSNEINKLNNYFLPIFQYDVINNNSYNILDLKVLICTFYSNFLTYNIDELDFITLNSFAINNILRTLNDCLILLNKERNAEIERIASNMIDSAEFLTIGSLQFFPEEQIKLLKIYYSMIEIKSDDFDLQKIKNQCFQRILDIFLLKTLPKEELENSIKKYLDNLFQYCYKELNQSFNNNEEFSNIQGNYTSYEKAPKVDYDIINFILDITNKFIEEDEKNIIKELSKSLLTNNNIIYKYTGLMIFPQIIESSKKFSEIESFIPIILNNISNSNNQIRFATAYCTCYFIINFKNKFIKKYSKDFLSALLNTIKNENCKHTKCEMILLFNTYISQLDEEYEDEANDDTDSGDELEDKNKINANINNNPINELSAKDYLNQNCEGIFDFLFQLFNNAIENDTQYALIKEMLLNSIIICMDFYGEKCKPFAIKFIEYFAKYLDIIYMNKKHENLYIGLLNVLSSFGKYEEDYFAKYLPSLFKCLEEILKNIKEKSLDLKHFQATLTNLLPIIINKNTELIPLFLKDIIDLLKYILNQDDKEEDSNINYIEDINSTLKVLSQSIEILEEKCINFIQPIEEIVFEINTKYKNNSNFHITISNILYYFIKIISEEKSQDRNLLKKLGKNYVDIIANMLKNELKISNGVILTEDFNKIIECIISYMEQNELESMFQGIIDLFNIFEERRIGVIKKKNKKENEKEEKELNKLNDNNNEEESLSSLEEEEDEEEDLINYFNKSITQLEQILENFSLIIENILKYGNKNYLNNIYNVIYTKILPLLINSEQNTPLLKKYQNNLKIAANLIDDIFEYSNFNILDQAHIQKLISILLTFTQNKKANIRQAAAYGLGIFIKLSEQNNIYPKYSNDILITLKASFEMFYKNKNNDILSREDGLSFDNFIAAIGKAIYYKNLTEIKYLYFWIENLPIKYDETEMEEEHDILCEFIINNKHILYKIDEIHLYKIVKIFLEIYKEKNSSNNDIDKKIKLIIKSKVEFRNVIDKIYNEYKSQLQNKIISKFMNKLKELTQ